MESTSFLAALLYMVGTRAPAAEDGACVLLGDSRVLSEGSQKWDAWVETWISLQNAMGDSWVERRTGCAYTGLSVATKTVVWFQLDCFW